MKFRISLTIVLAASALAACEGTIPQDLSRDVGIDSKPLSDLKAGIWVDPNGCEHWIIDDGFEGYMSERVTPSGDPVCGNLAPAGTVIGDFKRGSLIPDIF